MYFIIKIFITNNLLWLEDFKEDFPQGDMII